MWNTLYIYVYRTKTRGSLIAVNKSKAPDCDVRPIAIGEVLRRLTSRCLCAMVKCKGADYFSPHQLGVACPGGAETMVHSLRACVDRHWEDDDFVVLKVDLRNAFNNVSRQAVLDQCHSHFPELLPWVSWCYSHPTNLWHPLGSLSSTSGVQQGDPLGSLLFSLVIHPVIIEIENACESLSFNKWYLDDGALAGSKTSIDQALSILNNQGPPLGLFPNFSKCELFCKKPLPDFHDAITTRSNVPNFVILGSPIGNKSFCEDFASSAIRASNILHQQLQKLEDPQIALTLLRQCAAFCKVTHIALTTPPNLIQSALATFDDSVRACFMECTAIDLSPNCPAWKQATLSLSHGGMGLRSVFLHCSAAYISSISASFPDHINSPYLLEAINIYNALVSPNEALSSTFDSIHTNRHVLSQNLEDKQFQSLLQSSSLADRARLLSVSSPHASSWLRVAPSPALGLHLTPSECQFAIKWWLGIQLCEPGSVCALCPTKALEAHHALTCKRGSDVIARHNNLRDTLYHLFKKALYNPKLEAGSGLGHDQKQSRPADILVNNWGFNGKPAAFDLSVSSPLKPDIVSEAGHTAGTAAFATEQRKILANSGICAELGWSCIPLVVDSFGAWGQLASDTFKKLASRLSVQVNSSTSTTLDSIYSRLNLSLVRSNARAFLARAGPRAKVSDLYLDS